MNHPAKNDQLIHGIKCTFFVGPESGKDLNSLRKKKSTELPFKKENYNARLPLEEVQEELIS